MTSLGETNWLLRSANGDTPLHLAYGHNARGEIISYLERALPEMMNIANNEGMTPEMILARRVALSCGQTYEYRTGGWDEDDDDYDSEDDVA